MTAPIAQITRQLKTDEGVRQSAYQDTLGYWTIGVGRLIDARKGGGLRMDEIELLLANDIADRIEQLEARLPWFADLDPARQGVLVNMAFQLGIDGLLAFKNTLALIKNRDYTAASDAMLASKWAQQTPARAYRLAKQMESGQWQFMQSAQSHR